MAIERQFPGRPMPQPAQVKGPMPQADRSMLTAPNVKSAVAPPSRGASMAQVAAMQSRMPVQTGRGMPVPARDPMAGRGVPTPRPGVGAPMPAPDPMAGRGMPRPDLGPRTAFSVNGGPTAWRDSGVAGRGFRKGGMVKGKKGKC